MTKWFIGCSGWSYNDWLGRFYPENMDKKDFLRYYVTKFNTAEINSTFYQLPSLSTVWGWTHVPHYFKFSVKMWKKITHEAQLGKVEKLLDEFIETLKPLVMKNKLGVILIQLPPTFTKTTGFEKLEHFLALLPSNYKFAVEIRHESWIDESVFKLLEQYNVAWVIFDGPEKFPKVPPKITADFTYVRFHGRYERFPYAYMYKEEELKEWVPILKNIETQVKEVWLYFNNHFKAHAPINALKMIQLLGLKIEDLTPHAQLSLFGFLEKGKGK